MVAVEYDSDADVEGVEHVEELWRLSHDLIMASRTMGPEEARYLVDAYYIIQEDRKRTANQVRALTKGDEPHVVIQWLMEKNATLEKQIVRALAQYTMVHPMGSWMREVVGVGPVIAAGFLAHIDISRSPTVGHLWQFAGIAGSGQKVWKKGERRPFNASLKTLCWKLGQSFMKLSNNPDCYYGRIYRERKAYEIANNEKGLPHIVEQAAAGAARVKKTTDAYKSYSVGKLPPGHIDARARRYAVKLFLAHLHDEYYEHHFGEPPPLPYPVAFLGHAHIKQPPHRQPKPNDRAAVKVNLADQRAKQRASTMAPERAKQRASTIARERAIPQASTMNPAPKKRGRPRKTPL